MLHGDEPNYVIPTSEVVVDEAFIGSYSTALGLAPDGDTLFVATRTDTSLGFIHVDDSADGDDVLTCDSADEGRECSLRATPIVDPTTNEALVWPADPPDHSRARSPSSCHRTAGRRRERGKVAVLVSHRDGLVSLFTNSSDGEGYEFVDVDPRGVRQQPDRPRLRADQPARLRQQWERRFRARGRGGLRMEARPCSTVRTRCRSPPART